MLSAQEKFNYRRNRTLAWTLPVLLILNLAASWATFFVSQGDWLQVGYWLVTTCLFLGLNTVFLATSIDKQSVAWLTLSAMTATIIGAEIMLFSRGYLDTPSNSMFVALFAYLPLIFIFCFLLLSGQAALKACIGVWVISACVTFYFVIPKLGAKQQGAEDLFLFTLIGQPLAILLVSMLPKLENDLKNSELLLRNAEQNAITDALTGLLNRRGFDDALFQAWTATSAEKGIASLVLIDIDHFKQYNDALGHPAGDGCLVIIADKLNSIAKDHGLYACRYGGEEFALVGLIKERKLADKIARQCNSAIAGMKIKHPQPVVASEYVTVSVGYDVLSGSQGDRRRLIANADAALYQAKADGRDRVRQSLSQAA